jgi:hypothetical protein
MSWASPDMTLHTSADTTEPSRWRTTEAGSSTEGPVEPQVLRHPESATTHQKSESPETLRHPGLPLPSHGRRRQVLEQPFLDRPRGPRCR